MDIKLTKEEIDLLQDLLYKEKLKQDYLVKIGNITELPKELLSLNKKLNGDD